MFRPFLKLCSDAATARVILLLNHVLQGESVATDRLRPHAGKCIELQVCGSPLAGLLPDVFTVRVTPAGLIEWLEAPVQPCDLQVSIDGANPARAVVGALMGERPGIEVSGDALLAADVSWLVDNLRWDVQDDLARIIGDLPAASLGQWASGIPNALRGAVESLVEAAQRLRRAATGGGSEPPSR
jgi:ubiquinone biosynthesis protein UbiJ